MTLVSVKQGGDHAALKCVDGLQEAQKQMQKDNLSDVQEMLRGVFFCIAYIREFFQEGHFVESTIAGMNLKTIRRGASQHADRLLDWIEIGLFDALKRKYLETVILGIFEDPEQPQTMLETYTLKVAYPSSKEHQLLEISQKPNISLAINTDGPSLTLSASQEKNFQQQMAKILRTLCIMMQTLRPLPQRKYISMQVSYYDQLTPKDYEPPGFCSPLFDVRYLFLQSTFKHDFGASESAHYRVSLSLETTADAASKELSFNMEEGASHVTLHSDGAVPLCDSNNLSPTILPDTPLEEIHLKDQEKNNPKPKMQKIQSTKTPQSTPQKEPEAKVQCLCGDTDMDLDMIVCDQCGTWQHTPCVGYCTNKDKRIPETHVCYECQYPKNKKLLKNLQDLSSFRRAISVVYSEGLDSITWLSKRLACGIAKASKLIRRLESEGLVGKPNSQMRVYSYMVHKTPAAKEKIRYYFNLDLRSFPELAVFLQDPPKANTVFAKQCKPPSSLQSNGKRRKSVTAEKIPCSG